MTTLPHNLYRAEQVRELDRLAIEKFNIPSNVLMERAGEAAFKTLKQYWPAATRIAVLCGTGNNGGDGFVVARLAHQSDLQVTAFQVGDAGRLKDDALAAAQRLQGAGINAVDFDDQSLESFDLVVDGLLGTGLSGEVSDTWARSIDAINHSGKPVLSLDIPSGLNADSGIVMGAAVHADVTVTFIGIKRGLLMEEGREHTGQLQFESLAVPEGIYSEGPPSVSRLDYADIKGLLVRRHRAAHKGEFGHVLVVGGNEGFGGAVRMAGEAAARMGSGLVSLATHRSHAAVIASARPELMCHGVEREEDLKPLLERATVVVIGPGLGQDEWAQHMLAEVLDTKLPMVVDADALNLLAKDAVRRDSWILTPHPGEAARLLECKITEIQTDRFAATQKMQQKYGGVVILKGAGTIVRVSDGSAGLCAAGNPGMASGGMGDVLSGILAGLAAQGLSPSDAALLGVCLHAEAGDIAARGAGERGLLASDLMASIRRLANP